MRLTGRERDSEPTTRRAGCLNWARPDLREPWGATPRATRRPAHVLEEMIRDLRFCNESPAYHMWQVLEPRIETVRRALADQFGCDAAELAVTRNASEGMETLILGIDLKRGDEVIVTDHNAERVPPGETQDRNNRDSPQSVFRDQGHAQRLHHAQGNRLLHPGHASNVDPGNFLIGTVD